jgi:hypothetical protein
MAWHEVFSYFIEYIKSVICFLKFEIVLHEKFILLAGLSFVYNRTSKNVKLLIMDPC